MDNSRSIISDAFDKFKHTISKDHAHEFSSTKLEDVWQAVRKIDSSQRQRQSAQNLARIKPFLEGIEKYAKVIEVLCNGTPYLPYVWAPIKLMLQLASQHYEVFESLLAAYADIGAALPRFDRYEKIFSDIPSFRVGLATMYQSILDFHGQAYKLLSRKAWHVLFCSLWKDYKTRFAGIVEGLKKQRDFLDTEAMSIHMSESKDARARLQNELQESQKSSLAMLDQLESNAKISRLQHAVAWLAVDDKTQEENFERISNRRHDATCVWIAKNGQFISWCRDDGKNPVLWVSGKPGAGKSVICSYILHSLEQFSGKYHVCYYFCNSTEAGNICGQIMRTIALQLLRRNVDLASLVANSYVYPGSSCSLAQLRILLPQMLEVTKSTRVVIDGLDECSEESQMSVLKDLLRLLGKDVNCKVIIASRREVKIAEKLSNKPQIKLDNREEVESDIRLYVKYQVGSIETDDSEIRHNIESILVEKANGMFLWVRLGSEELRSCGSDFELEQTANSLPRGLKQAYGRILDRIMDEDHSQHARSLAIRTLEWIACAYRPLKTFEVLDGIVFKAGCTELNNHTKMRKSVLDFCRPLIEEGPSNTVDFVHFSAKEYILDEEYRNSTTFITRQTASLNIAFSCVAYLNTCSGLLSQSSTSRSRAALVLSGFHGLHLYANQFFIKHLDAYLASLAGSKCRASVELIAQLQILLQFSKRNCDSSSMPISTVNFEALRHYPQIVAFLLQVSAFRDGLKQEGAATNLLKSPEDLSMQSCESDPTHLSNARSLYQETVEALLNPDAIQSLPELHSRALQSFAITYGPAAYVCRYVHCSKATDGFDTFKEREAHEAAHQRKFRCADSSCVSFAAGFTSRNALNRHNEKWHRVMTQFTPLLVLLPGNPATRIYGKSGSLWPKQGTSGQRLQSSATSNETSNKHTPASLVPASNRLKTGETHLQPSVDRGLEPSVGQTTRNTNQDLMADRPSTLQQRPASMPLRRKKGFSRLNAKVMIQGQRQPNDWDAKNISEEDFQGALVNPGEPLKANPPVPANEILPIIEGLTGPSFAIELKEGIFAFFDHFGTEAAAYLMSLHYGIASFRSFDHREGSSWLVPIFCYLESYMENPPSPHVISCEADRVRSLNLSSNTRARYGYSPFEYSTFETSKSFVLGILRGLHALDLVECFNNPTSSNTIAQFAKLLAGQNLSAGPMTPTDLGVLIQRLLIPAGIGCLVLVPDSDSDARHWGRQLFQEIKYSVSGHKPPTVYLLQRGVVFDILYSEKNIEARGTEQDGKLGARNDLSGYMPDVTATSTDTHFPSQDDAPQSSKNHFQTVEESLHDLLEAPHSTMNHSIHNTSVAHREMVHEMDQTLGPSPTYQLAHDDGKSQHPEERVGLDAIDDWNAIQIQAYLQDSQYPMISLPLTPAKQAEQKERKSREFAMMGINPYRGEYQVGAHFTIGVFYTWREGAGHYVCKHRGGSCNQYFITVQEFQSHFETTHFRFIQTVTTWKPECEQCGYPLKATSSCPHCGGFHVTSKIYGIFEPLPDSDEETVDKARQKIIQFLAVQPLITEQLRQMLGHIADGDFEAALTGFYIDVIEGRWMLTSEDWEKVDLEQTASDSHFRVMSNIFTNHQARHMLLTIHSGVGSPKKPAELKEEGGLSSA